MKPAIEEVWTAFAHAQERLAGWEAETKRRSSTLADLRKRHAEAAAHYRGFVRVADVGIEVDAIERRKAADIMASLSTQIDGIEADDRLVAERADKERANLARLEPSPGDRLAAMVLGKPVESLTLDERAVRLNGFILELFDGRKIGVAG